MSSRTSLVLRAGAAVVALAALTACGDSSSTATDYSGPPSSSDSPSQSPSDSPSETPSDSTSAAPSQASGPCDYTQDPNGAAKKVDAPPASPTVKGQVKVDIATTIGDLHATLDGSGKPCTVGSFVSLAKQGYFDSTTCHRLVTSGIYVLQCGDPTATGTGGPGYTIPDELTGKEKYPAGTLAMANTGQPHSGGSQFFIVYKDTPLPPQYAVFGTVDAAAVKAISNAAAKGVVGGGSDGAPKEKVDISKVTVE